MAHTVFYNPDTKIIEAKVQGNLTETEANELIAEVIQIGRENKCLLCLSDYREAILNLSIFEIFEIPKKISKIVAPYGVNAAKLKRAIVVANNLKAYRFFETITLNSGQNIRLFQDIDKAKEWLLQK